MERRISARRTTHRRKTPRHNRVIPLANRRFKKKMKRVYLYRRILAAAVLLALLGGGWWLGNRLYFMLINRGLTTAFVGNGTVEETITAPAVVLREETVLISPISGEVHWLVKSGDRVRVGSEVVQVVNPEGKVAAEPLISEVSGQIAAFDTKTQTKNAKQAAEIEKYNQRIKQKLETLRNAVALADVSKIAVLQNELQQLIFERQQLVDAYAVSSKQAESQKEALLNRKQELEDVFAKTFSRVKATVPGIVSFTLDGREGDLNPATLSLWSPKDLLALTAAPVTVTEGGTVLGGQPLCKVMNNVSWYLALLLSPQEMDKLTTENVKIMVSSIHRGYMTGKVVERRPADESGKGMVLVKFNGFPLGIDQLRKTDAKIFIKNFTGITVPREAVVDQDGQPGIYRVTAGQAIFQPITVLGGDNNELVVEGLEPSAEIVTTPGKIRRNGQRIR